MEFLDRELARSRRHSRVLTLIMLDVDRFKAVNDRLGHLAGDFTLRELAARIRTTIRKEELFARYGGEEFAVILPETPIDKGIRAAERIRSLVAQQPFVVDGASFHITLSAGVVSTAGEEWLTSDEILRRADDKLYLAKKAGRNRVEA
jgi:diguanylate cyclase (GGDEF)-like protein